MQILKKWGSFDFTKNYAGWSLKSNVKGEQYFCGGNLKMRVGVAVCRWAPGSGLWKCKMGKFEGTTLAGEKPGLHCWPGAAPGSRLVEVE